MNIIEIELEDGSIAIWVVPDDKIDQVTDAIEAILGHPDTLKT